MGEMTDTLDYVINDPLELNLSYMPFIINGGLFVPTPKVYDIDSFVIVNLFLPGRKDHIRIEGKVIWMTPKNALHHVLPGIGVQFTGSDTTTIRAQIEAGLDSKMEVGGYTYGIAGDMSKQK